MISFTVTAKLFCVFVFAYAKRRFSHDEAHIVIGGDFVPVEYENEYEPVTTISDLEFPTGSDTNRAVRPQKMVRGLKFRI